MRGRLGEGVVRKGGLRAVRVGGWGQDDSAGWGSKLKADSLKAGGDQGPGWRPGGAGKKGRAVTQERGPRVERALKIASRTTPGGVLGEEKGARLT